MNGAPLLQLKDYLLKGKGKGTERDLRFFSSTNEKVTVKIYGIIFSWSKESWKLKFCSKWVVNNALDQKSGLS